MTTRPANEPPRAMRPAEEVECCDGGLFLNAETYQIERCDTCKRFATDEDAWNHASTLLANADAMHKALETIAGFVLDGEPCTCHEDDPNADHEGEHAMTIDDAFESVAAAVHLARAALGRVDA